VLEAMKMELPVRAPAGATVASIHCREGELVEADSVLIELTQAGPKGSALPPGL
jgi:biotin carboxyl carrier protein